MTVFFDVLVAHDNEYGIGIDNQLAWNIPEDMSFFRELTSRTTCSDKKNIVFMGRKTYESIPKKFRPLANRINIVLTRSQSWNDEGVIVKNNIEDLLMFSEMMVKENKVDHIYCIGGKEIYERMLKHPSCRRLYVTHVYGNFKCNVFLENYFNMFREIHARDTLVSKEKQISYQFKTYLNNNY